MMWGAIFDFDGVLVNSAHHHAKSWESLSAAVNKSLPADFMKRTFGMKNTTIIPKIFQWTEDPVEIAKLSKEKEILYRQQIQEAGIESLGGVVEWLQKLAEAEVPCVIGSSTDRLNIELVLKITGLAPYFQAIVSAEDVGQGKPDPEVFLKAAKKIAVEPAAAVVFEDAPVGLEAAGRAGMKRVAVTTSHPRALLEPLADLVVDRLDELSVKDVSAWFSIPTTAS